MIEDLNTIDTQLFLFLNGKKDTFFDIIMYWFSDKLVWVPMYLLIAIFIVKSYRNQSIAILLFTGLVIVFCDQTASHLIKNAVMRLRPSHDPALAGIIHLSKSGPGGMYGFVSSHVANAFGLATFLKYTLDNRFTLLKYWLYIWAVLVSYIRIYNGVHYPGDVIVAAFLGMSIGYGMAKLYQYLDIKHLTKYHEKHQN